MSRTLLPKYDPVKMEGMAWLWVIYIRGYSKLSVGCSRGFYARGKC